MRENPPFIWLPRLHLVQSDSGESILDLVTATSESEHPGFWAYFDFL